MNTQHFALSTPRRLSRLARAMAIALLVLAAPLAQAERWSVVQPGSSIGITTAWEGEPFDSVFDRFDAAVEFAPGRRPTGRLSASIDTGSIGSGMRVRDRGMLGPIWLDAIAFPVAKFVAQTFRALGDDRFVAVGQLVLKGASVAVEVPFEWHREGDSARLSGALMLDRRDFDIGAGEWLTDSTVSFEVAVRYDLRLRRAND